jgi:peroxiredoxin
VSKAGEFTLATRITGSYVRLARVKAGKAFDPDARAPKCFLEGYAELRVTGSVRDWYHVKTSGGLYDHHDMRRLVSDRDSAYVMQEEAVALLARARKTGDTLSRGKIGELLDRSNAIFGGGEFRVKHPEMAYSAALLRDDFLIDQGIDKYEEAFNALAPEARESLAGRLVRDFIANARASGVGAVAPDFTLADMNGKEVTLSAFRGKHVLIDFWGSGCGPCRQVHPAQVELYAALQAKGADVEFIGIACEDDEYWREAIEEDKLAWIQLNDTYPGKSKSIHRQYAVKSVPDSLLISPEGEILYRDHPVAIISKVKELFEL